MIEVFNPTILYATIGALPPFKELSNYFLPTLHFCNLGINFIEIAFYAPVILALISSSIFVVTILP